MPRAVLRCSVVAALLAAACSGAAAPPPASTTLPTVETTVPATVPGPLAALEERVVALDGVELLVAVAQTPQERARGLMGITDLGSLDGMLFVLDAPAVTRFWMKDTLIPLDIGFFDDAGAFVAAFTMEPCTADPCPSYGPAAPVRFALEMPAGTLPALDAGSTLDPGG